MVHSPVPTQAPGSGIAAIVGAQEQEILSHWLSLQTQRGVLQSGRIREAELQAQSRNFLRLLAAALNGGDTDIAAPVFAPVRDFLTEIARTRAIQGFTSAETATFVLSTWVGAVPSMNHSLTVFAENGPGNMPVNASTVVCATPGGGSKSAIGWPFVAAVRNDCHSEAAVSSETTPPGGAELSELPIQAPTTNAGAFGSAGGARYPIAVRSFVSFVVPVFRVAGRRVLPS